MKTKLYNKAHNGIWSYLGIRHPDILETFYSDIKILKQKLEKGIILFPINTQIGNFRVKERSLIETKNYFCFSITCREINDNTGKLNSIVVSFDSRSEGEIMFKEYRTFNLEDVFGFLIEFHNIISNNRG